MTMMTSTPAQPAAQSSTGGELLRGFSSISNRLTDRLQSGALGNQFESLISGVKNLLPINKDLTITKITESIMDPASASSSAIAKTESYLYFDPRSANARGTVGLPPVAGQSNNLTRSGGANAHGGLTSNMPGGLGSLGPGTGASFGQRRQGYADAVVFTVGGGCMDEYGNLQEWARRTSGAGATAVGVAGGAAGPRKRVVYGSTEIVNAEDFVMGDLRKLGAEAA
jgi:hypothetical protein